MIFLVGNEGVCVHVADRWRVLGRQMQTVTEQEIQTGLIVFSHDWHTRAGTNTYGGLEVLHIVLKPILYKLVLQKEMCAGYLRGPSVDLLLVLVVPDCSVYVCMCKTRASKEAQNWNFVETWLKVTKSWQSCWNRKDENRNVYTASLKLFLVLWFLNVIKLGRVLKWSSKTEVDIIWRDQKTRGKRVKLGDGVMERMRVKMNKVVCVFVCVQRALLSVLISIKGCIPFTTTWQKRKAICQSKSI